MGFQFNRSILPGLWAAAQVALLAGAASGAGVIVAQPAEARPSPSPFAAAYEAVAPALVRVAGDEDYSSGLIVSEDGLILTHGDVARKNELSVLFADGREAKAKVLLRDAATKTAVLQLMPAGTAGAGGSSSKAATSGQAATSARAPAAAVLRHSWQPAKLGSSRNLSPGTWVATVAYPIGTDMKNESQPSLSVGLLVARGAFKTKLSYDGDWLVTDAMMNEASEGGALIDSRGLVVGLLSKPQRNEETNTALNLALPVELAAGLIKRARETPDPPLKEEPANPAAKRGFLGIKGSADAGPCRIISLISGSPAERAGLKAGDVIVRFGRTEIGNYDDLRRALRQTHPGQRVFIALRRQGEDKEKEFEVILGKTPVSRN